MKKFLGKTITTLGNIGGLVVVGVIVNSLVRKYERRG